MSFTINFGDEALLFALDDGQTSIRASEIEARIRTEKNVTGGCISRLGNIVMRITNCADNGIYRFVNSTPILQGKIHIYKI